MPAEVCAPSQQQEEGDGGLYRQGDGKDGFGDLAKQVRGVAGGIVVDGVANAVEELGGGHRAEREPVAGPDQQCAGEHGEGEWGGALPGARGEFAQAGPFHGDVRHECERHRRRQEPQRRELRERGQSGGRA